MRAAVVYESMYGNTRRVAEAIGAALATTMEVAVMPVSRAVEGLREPVDLLVLGGPTHTWSMSRPVTRRGAADAAAKRGSTLTLEPSASGPGVGEWLAQPHPLPAHVAAFDTRRHAPMHLQGSAAKPMARRLRDLGLELVAPPEGFYVTKEDTLVDGELERAGEWARTLAASVAAHTQA